MLLNQSKEAPEREHDINQNAFDCQEYSFVLWANDSPERDD